LLGEKEDWVGLKAEWSVAQGKQGWCLRPDESAQKEREFSQSQLLRIPFYLYSMISPLRIPSAWKWGCITYELLSHIIKHSSSIISLFKELENIRINA
jgi:hypothetical protein